MIGRRAERRARPVPLVRPVATRLPAGGWPDPRPVSAATQARVEQMVARFVEQLPRERGPLARSAHNYRPDAAALWAPDELEDPK